MSTFLPPRLEVAAAGRRWEVGDFVLWESSQAGVVLFVPQRPRLAVGAEQRRFQAAVSVSHGPGAAPGPGPAGQADGSFAALRMTGGGAAQGSGQAGQETLAGSLGFTVTAGVEADPAATVALEARWRDALTRAGYPDARRARFVPLPSRQARVRCEVDPAFGILEGDAFGIHEGSAAGAGEGDAGERESGDLQGLVFVLLRLTDLGARQVLAAIKQGAEVPATAGVVRVTYEYPVSWRQASGAGEPRSEGIGWLGASMAIDLATLLAPLDSSYLTEVTPRPRPRPDPRPDTPADVPLTIAVAGDPLLRSVAVSWSSPEEPAPHAVTFGPEGGTARHVLSSTTPDRVGIRYQAKVSFVPPSWPVLETGGEATLTPGDPSIPGGATSGPAWGYRISLAPADWVGHQTVSLFVRDGDTILATIDSVNTANYVIVNVEYDGPHLPVPLKSSARLRPGEHSRFDYVRDPGGRPGRLSLSAFGVVRGQIVRVSSQPVAAEGGALFLLAGADGVELLGEQSLATRTDDIARQLLEARAHSV